MSLAKNNNSYNESNECDSITVTDEPKLKVCKYGKLLKELAMFL